MSKSKYLKYICSLLCLLVAAALLGACDNRLLDREDEEVEVVPGRSIAFSTGGVTRAVQMSDLRENDFGIKAYLLDNVWASAGYNATPTVNWNDVRVSCDDMGVCSYTPRQMWVDNKYYTFFGYFPYADPSVTVSGSNDESTPYIEYRPSADDPTRHRDVMVASTFDCTSVNTGQVRMQFSHVLFCVNIAANNFNDEAIELNNVTCHFTSNLYGTYKINMDNSDPIAGDAFSGARYVMANSVRVPNTETTGAMNITDTDRFLMLIPQTGLTGKISFTVTQNGVTTSKEVAFDDSSTTFRAGYRYAFTLYFVGDAIHFRIIQSNEWTDNDSDIEFD